MIAIMRINLRMVATGLVLAACVACRQVAPTGHAPETDLETFLDNADTTLLRLSNESSQAGWVQATYITPDTEAISARANEAYVNAVTDYAKRAATFAPQNASPERAAPAHRAEEHADDGGAGGSEGGGGADAAGDVDGRRVRAGQVLPAGRGEYGRVPRYRGDHRDPRREIATRPACAKCGKAGTRSRRRCKKDYVRFVELSNKGAKELGFADTGAMWRSRYDMPPDDFAKELDRLWEQLRPLYLSLHTYVRARLHAKYGDAVPADGPIPAHLLGNIWAQDWSNVYDLVAPPGGGRGCLA